MADSEIPASSTAEPDVEMGSVDPENLEEENGIAGIAEGAGEDDAPTDPQTTFIDYLKSPIVQLIVGYGDETTQLTAHEALLTESPFFAEKLSAFEDDDEPRRIDLPDDSLDAVGCFLQYQYTGEYFPRRLPSDTLESDPAAPEPDNTGAQLLKHARVYTLAEKLSLPALKTLAHSKIHRINSTAKGEIAYARYVYANTPKDDMTIRRPVAAFWATRSHVLRHEAEDEFRAMCLEFPQFGFDVLNLVLDQREKRRHGESHAAGGEEPGSAVKGSARKRTRVQL